MLTAKEVKPLLVHQDRTVRKAAVRYFHGTWSRDVELVPLILQAFRTYGADEDIVGLAFSSQFALDAASMDDVLDTLGTATDSAAILNLNRTIANAPVELQISHEATILDVPNLMPQTATSFQRRQKFSRQSSSELWIDLQNRAESSEEDQYVDDIDFGYLDDLVAILASHAEPGTEAICQMLKSAEESGWMEVFLVDLIGERRIREAVPLLVDLYQIDADYLLERATIALGKIGDPEAVRLIQSAFAKHSWNFKNYSLGVLGDIKHQDSETAILALLEAEEDMSIRTRLCGQLCRLFSARGVEIALEQIRFCYDGKLDSLGESLLPVARVLGIDIPEEPEWQAEIEERERVRAQRRAEMEELGRRYTMAKASGRDPFAKLKQTTEPEPSVEPSVTIQNDAPRVGRNDLCPCGSGKKFKKCCLRKPR